MSATFNFTGAVQTYTVPAGITSLVIECWGAQGGPGANNTYAPGQGGYTKARLAVTPGEVLNVYVGGQGGGYSGGAFVKNGSTAYYSSGGWNGGGNGSGNGSSGGGGGASDVRRGGTAYANRKIVAGGGGGCAYDTSYAYPGGGLSGGGGSRGGTQTAGGTYYGTLGQGGYTSTGMPGGSEYGGGGGGGYYGGGAGAGQNVSGGGGSSYVDPSATETVLQQGGRSGNGLVVITYNSAPIAPTISAPAVGAIIRTALVALVGSVLQNSMNLVQESILEYQLATDAGFTQNLKTVREPTSAYRVSGQYTLVLSEADALTQTKWYARARAIPNDDQDPSGWSEATSFTVSHPPAVTNMTPSGGGGVGYGPTTHLAWRFSDTSPIDSQSAYQIQVERNADGGTVIDTGKVPSTDSYADLALDASLKGVELRWRIKVWDSENVEGSWSQYSIFTPNDAPAVGIDTPSNGGVITSNAPVVSWSVTNFVSRYEAAYRVTVTKVGDAEPVFDSGTKAGNATSYVASAPKISSGNDYEITVFVTDNTGIVGSASITVTAQYEQPASISPDVDVSTYDLLGYVRLTWLADTDPEFVRWRIYRRVAGDLDWAVLADVALGTVTEYHDWLALSMETYDYYVTQIVSRFGQEIESSVVAPVTVTIPSGGYWLIDPVDASNNTRLDNVSEDAYSEVIEQAELVIIGRGRHVDVGETAGISGSLTAQLRDSQTGAARFKKKRIEGLKLLKKPAYLRNPFGDLNLINMGDVQVSRIAGVGSQEAVDVTIPYLEIS